MMALTVNTKFLIRRETNPVAEGVQVGVPTSQTVVLNNLELWLRPWIL